jgi:MYXO-CTERM domain-containing protein
MKQARKCKLQAAILAGAGFLFASTAAHAATTAVTVAAGTKTTNTGDWAAGWEFTVSTSIQVTQLGKFDYENNGLVGTAVGLYNRTTGGTQLATVSLVGASSELSGAYTAYYATLPTPITLTPGNTYTIVAVQDGPSEAIFWANSTATYASEITYVRGIASAGASLPATFTSNSPNLTGTTQGYFGGTFKFDPVPEPSGALLGGLGMLALLRRRR